MTPTAKPTIWQGDTLYLFAIVVFALGWNLVFGEAWPGSLVESIYTDTFTYMIRVTEAEWWSDRGQFAAYNTPFGTVLHWTFPFPALITALAAPFALILPWGDAVAIAGSFSSFLCLIAVAFGLYRLTRYLTTPGWAAIGTVVAISCQPIFNYGQLGRPDHHMLALATVVWFWVALAGMELGERRRLASIAAGLVAALALWTTPETMPGLVGGIALQIWYRLCQNLEKVVVSAPTDRLINDGILAVTWLLGTTAAVLIDPPFEGQWAPAYDRISIVHLAFVCCTGMLLVARSPLAQAINPSLPGKRFIQRVLATGILGLSVVGLFLFAFPESPAGALNHVSPAMEPWISAIQEMQPATKITDILINYTGPIFGLIALALLLEDQEEGISVQKLLLLGVIGCCAGLTLVGIIHYRFSYYAVAAVAPFIFHLPKRLAEYGHEWLQPDKTVALMLALPLVTVAINKAVSEEREPTYNLFGRSAVELALAANGELEQHYEQEIGGRPNSPATFPGGQAACDSFPMVHQLAEIVPQLSVASGSDQKLNGMFPQNPGPALVYTAGIRVVAAPYHRNEDGLLASQSFYSAYEIEGVPQMILENRSIDLVGVCVKPVIDQPDLERPGVYSWALAGGDEDYAPALIIPGRWVILARRSLLGDWAPVFFVDERDLEDANTEEAGYSNSPAAPEANQE
ncbi:MAG: hypothetical protein KI792_00925 [Alphaproteobacteria bacterium]|nr:hypothetical protein [Alphaproteobacteria bacterium SS10]